MHLNRSVAPLFPGRYQYRQRLARDCRETFNTDHNHKFSWFQDTVNVNYNLCPLLHLVLNNILIRSNRHYSNLSHTTAAAGSFVSRQAGWIFFLWKSIRIKKLYGWHKRNKKVNEKHFILQRRKNQINGPLFLVVVFQ